MAIRLKFSLFIIFLNLYSFGQNTVFKNYILNNNTLKKTTIINHNDLRSFQFKELLIFLDYNTNLITSFNKNTTKKYSSFYIPNIDNSRIIDNYIISYYNNKLTIYNLNGKLFSTLDIDKNIQEFIFNHYNKRICIVDEILYYLDQNLNIMQFDLNTGQKKSIINKEKDNIEDKSNKSCIFYTIDGLICIKDLDGESGYKIYKYDFIGKEINNYSLKHSFKDEKTKLLKRNFDIKSYNNEKIIFCPNEEKSEKQTIELDLSTFKIKELSSIIDFGIIDNYENSNVYYGKFQFSNNKILIYDESLFYLNNIELKTKINTNNFNIMAICQNDTLGLCLYDNNSIEIQLFDLKSQSKFYQNNIKTDKTNDNLEITNFNFENDNLIIKYSTTNTSFLKLISISQKKEIFSDNFQYTL